MSFDSFPLTLDSFILKRVDRQILKTHEKRDVLVWLIGEFLIFIIE